MKNQFISYVPVTLAEDKWLAKNVFGDEWGVRSAGIEAHGLNPNAVKVMEEVGVEVSSQKSELIDIETF